MAGCTSAEYMDDVLGQCLPCSSLCRRGPHAGPQCMKLCSAFLNNIVKLGDVTTDSYRFLRAAAEPLAETAEVPQEKPYLLDDWRLKVMIPLMVVSFILCLVTVILAVSNIKICKKPSFPKKIIRGEDSKSPGHTDIANGPCKDGSGNIGESYQCKPETSNLLCRVQTESIYVEARDEKSVEAQRELTETRVSVQDAMQTQQHEHLDQSVGEISVATYQTHPPVQNVNNLASCCNNPSSSDDRRSLSSHQDNKNLPQIFRLEQETLSSCHGNAKYLTQHSEEPAANDQFEVDVTAVETVSNAQDCSETELMSSVEVRNVDYYQTENEMVDDEETPMMKVTEVDYDTPLKSHMGSIHDDRLDFSTKEKTLIKQDCKKKPVCGLQIEDKQRVRRHSNGYKSASDSNGTPPAIPKSIPVTGGRKPKTEVFKVLEMLSVCRMFFDDEDKVEVQVSFDEICYHDVISLLKETTGWEEIEFRIRDYLPTTFEAFGPVQGQRIFRHASIEVSEQHTAKIGAYLKNKATGELFALSVAHACGEGEPVYVDGSPRPIGQCVELVSHHGGPESVDLAIVKLEEAHAAALVSAPRAQESPLRFPFDENEAEERALYRCEAGSVGAYLRHTRFTDKARGIHAARTCIRVKEEVPVMRAGDCGSLLITAPPLHRRSHDPRHLVLGMMVGRLTQVAEDGGEPHEYYIAMQLQQALDRSHTFRAQGYELFNAF